VEFEPVWKNAKYYTGVLKPADGMENFRASHDQWLFDTATGMVYKRVSAGMIQPSVTADLGLVCPTYCVKFSRGGGCERYSKCPKASWAGLTLEGDSKNTAYAYVPPGRRAITAVQVYKYKWKKSDVQLYTFTNNDGVAGAETKLDATTNVVYGEYYWGSTVSGFMYPFDSTVHMDSKAEIDAYHKSDGNLIYKVGVGKLGGYDSWSFFVKEKGKTDYVSLENPLSCTVTMDSQTDANGGTDYVGTKFALTFYGMFTEGLSWEKAKLGNGAVGENEQYLPSPQVADGTLCVNGDTKYRLKADAVSVIPDELPSTGCTLFGTSMNSPGNLPTSAESTTNTAVTPTDVSKMCVDKKEFTKATGCSYLAGMSSTSRL